MAIAFRASAFAAGQTSVAPAIPTGTTTGDIMELHVGCKPFNATINTPSGWTLVSGSDGNNGSVANAIDLGSVLWATFYREWQSGDAAPTVSITSGDVVVGLIKSFSKSASATWATPVGAKGSDTTSGTDFSLTMDADPGIVVGDLLDSMSVVAGDNTNFGSPVISATGVTFGAVTEGSDITTSMGNDLNLCHCHAICTAGTSLAAPVVSWTLTVAQTGGGNITRLREAVPPTIQGITTIQGIQTISF